MRSETNVPTNDALRNSLIACAQSGDAGAFEALFNMHKRRVFSLCLHRTESREVAEDLTETIFLRAFREISTIHTLPMFSARLYELTAHIASIRLREGAARLPG